MRSRGMGARAVKRCHLDVILLSHKLTAAVITYMRLEQDDGLATDRFPTLHWKVP